MNRPSRLPQFPSGPTRRLAGGVSLGLFLLGAIACGGSSPPQGPLPEPGDTGRVEMARVGSEEAVALVGPSDEVELDAVMWAGERGWSLARATPPGLKDALGAAEAQITRLGKATGEVRSESGRWGTGFVVADGWVATAGHVATAMPVGAWFEVGGAKLRIDDRRFDPEGADVALLRVKVPDEVALTVAKLRVGPPGDAGGRLALVVGYPGRAPETAAELATFPEGWDKKWLSAGTATWVGGARLLHTCPTLRGHSGSPLLDLASGEVVGIHVEGDPAKGSNRAVAAGVIRRMLEGVGP